MTWLMWRQHRASAAIAAVLVTAFGVVTVVSGRSLADKLAACRAGGSCGGSLLDSFRVINPIVDLTVAVPCLIGVFWGATLVAREFETGTAVLAWTQTVTRRRWLVGKLAILLCLTSIGSGAVAALVTWWSNTHNSLVESRFSGLQFDIQGVVPVAYSLFAAAVGLCAGTVWRRVVPAMAATVGAFIGVRMVVELFVRSHYAAPRSLVLGMAQSGGAPSGSLVISSDITLHGQVVSGPISIPDACGATATRPDMNDCMSHAGYALRIVYQPAERWWTFQWIESGIFVGLAAVLVAVAAVLVLRRDA